MIRYYLGEDAVLDNVETYRLEDADERGDVARAPSTSSCSSRSTARAARARHRPAAPRRRSSTRLRAARRADPAAGSPSRSVALSTAPDVGRRRAGPRHVDLRPFAVNDGERVWVLPGRPDPGGAAGGRARRQLQPGRRLQGHLGARRRGRRHGRAPAAGAASPAAARVGPYRRDGPPMDAGPPIGQAAATAAAADEHALLSRVAESIVLDRPLRRAGRGHVPRILDVIVYQPLDRARSAGRRRRPRLLAVMGLPRTRGGR